MGLDHGRAVVVRLVHHRSFGAWSTRACIRQRDNLRQCNNDNRDAHAPALPGTEKEKSANSQSPLRNAIERRIVKRLSSGPGNGPLHGGQAGPALVGVQTTGNAPTTEPADPLSDITTEQVNQVIEMLREHTPILADQLAEAQKKNPEAVRTMLRDHPKLLDMIRNYRTDPKLFGMRLRDIRFEKQTHEAVSQYKQALRSGDQSKIDSAKNDLTKLLSDHFQFRQQMREQELEHLEQKISQLRNQLETRKSHKDQLIADRLKELTDNNSNPEW